MLFTKKGWQLWGADDHVKIVFIGELTVDNGEQGESASQVCLFVSLMRLLWDPENFVAKVTEI